MCVGEFDGFLNIASIPCDQGVVSRSCSFSFRIIGTTPGDSLFQTELSGYEISPNIALQPDNVSPAAPAKSAGVADAYCSAVNIDVQPITTRMFQLVLHFESIAQW